MVKTHIKQYFWTGLITIIPLACALWVGKILFHLITKPFDAIAKSILSLFAFAHLNSYTATITHLLSKGLSISFLLALLILLGCLGRWVIFHWIFNWGEAILLRVPVVKNIYKSCKDFTDILFTPKKQTFSKVALIDFPCTGQKAVGLITNCVEFDAISGKMEKYYSVLVPGTPNPTVGLLLFIHEKDVEILDATVEQAMKFIMSCGTVTTLPYSEKKPAKV